MNNSNKKLKIKILIISLLTLGIFIFIYEYYFHEYYGRNEKAVQTACIIEETANSLLQCEKNDYSNANADMILSNNKKFRYNDNIGDKFYDQFENVAKETHGIDYDKGQYYIEIRDHKVYKVIYATWMYSGYVGIYPQYSDQAKAYKNVVKEARKEFKEYLDNKEK